MGATSVTGVGPGSVRGFQKGDKHASLGVSRLIGPRVVVAGQVTLVGGAATIDYPDLGGVATDYIVLATADAANAVGVTAFDTDSATFAGTGTDVISYSVIRVGLGIPTIQV